MSKPEPAPYRVPTLPGEAPRFYACVMAGWVYFHQEEDEYGSMKWIAVPAANASSWFVQMRLKGGHIACLSPPYGLTLKDVIGILKENGLWP